MQSTRAKIRACCPSHLLIGLAAAQQRPPYSQLERGDSVFRTGIGGGSQILYEPTADVQMAPPSSQMQRGSTVLAAACTGVTAALLH
eukprot:SAG31_NODE_436_length_15717_cov_5.420412_9_plen_87_part_00